MKLKDLISVLYPGTLVRLEVSASKKETSAAGMAFYMSEDYITRTLAGYTFIDTFTAEYAEGSILFGWTFDYDVIFVSAGKGDSVDGYDLFVRVRTPKLLDELMKN